MTQDEQVFSLLMNLCPESIKPFAEFMLPTAIAQMEEDKKVELLDRLESLKDAPEQENAEMLIAFAKSMGAEPSMFGIDMPELEPYFK